MVSRSNRTLITMLSILLGLLCRRAVGIQDNALFENEAFSDAPYHAVLSAMGGREKYFMSQEGAVRR